MVDKPKNLLDFSFTWIHTAEAVTTCQSQLDAFFMLYQHAGVFPHAEVREDPAIITQRILQHHATPETFILMIEHLTTRAIVGGCVLEFYPQSQCFLLTYIFTHPQYRGNGLGRAIFDDERGIRQIVGRAQLKARALFAEVTDPQKTSQQDDSLSPSQRALFFASVGGRKVAIDYQSPPLNSLEQPLDYLMLITFPELCPISNPFAASIFNDFYQEFCASLHAEPPLQVTAPLSLLPLT